MSAASESLNLESAPGARVGPPSGVALQVIIFLAAFALVLSHRPDAIFNAQFYAEDGKYFYSHAYQFGWRCLFIPYGGSLHILLRLIGLFALLFPLGIAPLVMNLCAMVVQILPVNLFLSDRFSVIPFYTRALGSFMYLVLPNSSEIHVNTTNIQWHLALIAVLIVLSQAEFVGSWRYFDYPVLLLAILDGPLSIILIPIAAFLYWKRRERRIGQWLAVLASGAICQSFFILFSNSRRPALNGASVVRLVSILGRQVFMGSLLGTRTLIQLVLHVHSLFVFEAIATVIGLAVVLYALRYAPLQLKLFLLFCMGVFALCLAKPIATTDGNLLQWEVLRTVGNGQRYYFFPGLAFLASLVWIALGEPVHSAFRYAALLILLLMPIGIVRDWLYPTFADFDFQHYVEEFDRAAPGTTVIIPINPDWQMQLTKK
jgi:hypothetical protein